MSELAKCYARAKEALPQAVAIGIMAGVQTHDADKPLEWWTVTTHTEPIGHPLDTRRSYNGDTFGSALAQAIIGEGEMKKVICDHAGECENDVCIHKKVHEFDVEEWCFDSLCSHINKEVKCVEATDAD